MTKSEIKAIMKRLDRIERNLGTGRNTELENLTEVFIEIYGVDYIDEVFYGAFSGNKAVSTTMKKYILFTLLTTQKKRVRQQIVGYFLGTGEPTIESYLKKHMEFQRVLITVGAIKKRKAARNGKNL